MCERAEPFAVGALRNNNQQGAVLPDGDANANDIHAEIAGVRGDLSTQSAARNETAEQDKIIIWGTDSQCDDPELAEFEMLECQELEAYLVEDETDFVGLAERKELLEQSFSCGKATVDHVQDCKSCERETSASLVSEGKEASRTELTSETDVYVSCLSTISSLTTAVDPVGRSQMTDSWQVTTGPYSTASEDLTLPSQTCKADHSHLSSPQSSKKQKEVDINLNLTPDVKDVVSQAQVTNGVVTKMIVADEHRRNNNQRNEPGRGFSETTSDRGRNQHKDLPRSKSSHEETSTKMDKSTQADEPPEATNTAVATGTKENQPLSQHRSMKKQGSFDNTLKKQNSFDRSFKKQPSFENSFKKQLSFDNSLKKQDSSQKTVNSNSSSLERRKPWGSPSRTASSLSSKTASSSPKRRPPASPAKVQGVRALSSERSSSPQTGLSHAGKPPGKMLSSSGIPKPVMSQHKEPDPTRSSSPQRPKNVRPKIITYVRANQAKPQVADSPHEALTRLSSHSSPPAQKDSKVAPKPKSTPVLCSSNLLFDKYRQEMQKTGHCPPGTAGVTKTSSGPIAQRLTAKSGSFHEEGPEKYYKEQQSSQEGGNVYCSPRTLRPQLGLGAVNRQPAAKTRVPQMGQRPNQGPNQSSQAAAVSNQAVEQKRSGPENTPKSILLKPGQSGLRPPGFSALPSSRLTTFGFTRSHSISPVPSNQSADSSNSDLCRPAPHPSSGIDEASSHSATSADPSRCQSWNQPPNAPSLQRRSLAPQRSSPVALRRETTKDNDSQPKSSPKRFAVVSPKPQSPVRGRTAPVHVPVPVPVRVDKPPDLDKAVIQQLRDRCEQQALQLQSLQVQMKEASLCLDVFSVTTQHFWKKNENAIVKERELSLELAKIRDEVAFSTAHWKQLQREKEELERHFELELQGLRARQQRELGALEERLKEEHAAKMESLQDQQQAEMEELQIQQQEQIDEINENHEASLMELESVHSDTLSTLQEEHARTVKNLKMAHEQQRRSLEVDFEKIRLSLQDQVDTLTFQNRSLRDRAKRFEEALRKSTDEQIVDALAPYKHIEEDLKSLKEVLEMKNQQIHQQELKITELEKIAEKNVHLEERLQVLQQQNEDLKERIDKNMAVSRQLTEENANLQVHVEMESKEKKRLSRTNEELMWRLQTGELSPHMSPTSSPLHRPTSGPGSPSRPHSYHQ